MKDKKTFGSFIKQKRIEKNYSQNDLAELLFVTESAVSKWERGVTYPDITLISDICKVLDVTEHELIEAGNDFEYQEIKRTAKKYNKLKKVLFWILNICYVIAILTCFIVNLAIEGTLSWFFIVLCGCLCGYTFCPTVSWISKKFKLEVFIASSFISLFLLLLTISIYVSDYWFMIPTMGILLGYFIVFYPILFVKQKNYLNEEKYQKLSKVFLLSYSFTILILLILLLVFIHIYNPFNLLLGLIIVVGGAIIPVLFGVLLCLGSGKKVIKGILFTFLGLVLVFVIWLLIEAILLNSNTEINTYVIEDKFESIQFNMDTYDINIYLSKDSEDKLVCSENDKVTVNYEVIDGTLIVSQNDNRSFHIGLGFSFKVDLYVTKDFIDNLEIDISTGDVKVNTGFTFNSVNISSSTGDVSFNSKVSTNLNIDLSTGTGVIKDSEIEGNLKVKVSTGNIEMLNLKCNELTIKSSTGDTKLSNVLVTNDFNYISSTGDLKFDGFDAKNIYVEVGTGDVKGTLLSPKIFNCQTSTGNINVPETYEGGICKIKTSTGNINISYK